MNGTDGSARAPGEVPRIVILGGGVGAMTAAFALTDRPDWQRDYRITVYQLGWRLGGKGACGRNATLGDRIEEHGLHVWFGFYENAFRMMRRCLRALETGNLYPEVDEDPDAARALLERYFERGDAITLTEPIEGRWHPWEIAFPRNDEVPGTADSLPTVFDYLRRVITWLRDIVRGGHDAIVADTAEAPDADFASIVGSVRAGGLDLTRDDPADLMDAVVGLVTAQPGLLARAELAIDFGLIVRMIDRVVERARRGLARRIAADPDARRLFVMIDLAGATVRGLVADGVLRHGFAAIDDRDFEAWLADHHASTLARRSAFVRAVYGLGFAFDDGDPTKPRAAAGVALHGLLRLLFTYRGSVMWKMRTGMGDAIFEPLHRLLSARGVEFKFFHRVRAVEPSADGTAIERLVIGQQVHPRDDYPYFRTVNGKRCWPNEPSYTHLAEAAEIEALRRDPTKYVDLESYWSSWDETRETRITLTRGEDFEWVVLGISLGALPLICSGLAARRPRWRRMFERVKTIPTQAFQLWLRKTPEEISDYRTGTVLGAFVEPLDTWGDMSQTLWAERWPAEHEPRQVAYFCGVLPDRIDPTGFADPRYPVSRKADAYANMRAFLINDIRHLWPRAVAGRRPTRLDWRLLVDPRGGTGEERLVRQFWIANVEPPQRYVLSLPGTIGDRLRADASEFANLVLAGDWTYTGINAGAVEGAVMSGLRAARAISGRPLPIVGEDD